MNVLNCGLDFDNLTFGNAGNIAFSHFWRRGKGCAKYNGGAKTSYIYSGNRLDDVFRLYDICLL